MMKTTLCMVTFSLATLLAQGCATEVGEGDETISTTKAAVTAGGIYEIRNALSNRCLDIAYGSADNGANAQIYDCWGGSQQQFEFEAVESGYFRLRNVASNKCLEVWGWSTSDGGDIRQYDCHSGYSQQFIVSDAGGGKFTFINRHSGKAVEAAGWGTANGTNVDQWIYGGGDNQKWHLAQVGGSVTTSTSSSVGESDLPSACFDSQRLYMTNAQLAVAMARELGEINPVRDLFVDRDRLALSPQGWSRCSGESNGCETVRAILEMQDDRVNQTIDQNVFNASTFRSTLVSQYGDQINWETNHSASLPGAHSLTLVATTEAYCGTDFEFQVNWECTSCNQDESAIRNRMARFFRANNTVIDFRAANGKVTIDPTGAMNDDSTASGGGCTDACLKLASSNLDGECCRCDGKEGTFVKDGLKLMCATH